MHVVYSGHYNLPETFIATLCSLPESCSGMAVCVLQIWIVGILALSAFWCLLSLLAISRLERRLPSEMQDQLEFHTAFSGLWPKAQGATAGERAFSKRSRLCLGQSKSPNTILMAPRSVNDATHIREKQMQSRQ